MKDKLFRGSTPAPAKRPGCVEFQGEAEKLWAVAGDPVHPSSLVWTPEACPAGWEAVGVAGAGGQLGGSSARGHANRTRTPTPQMALGVLSPRGLSERLAPTCHPTPRAGVSLALPLIPWVASGEAATSLNLCFLICKMGVPTPFMYASQGV